MARLRRSTFPAYGVWHVTTRGVEQRAVFLDDADRRSFLSGLWRAASDNLWIVYVVCLMTNHYHLVAEGRRDLVSRGMHRLNGRYAQSFNAKYGRTGHLWGDRFVLWQVRDEVHLEAACRYVLLNPVRAGLCRASADWPWSWSRHGLATD